MKLAILFVFAALIATACAVPGFAEYTIFTDSACSSANMVAIISDVLADGTNCLAAYCEQIGTSGQYRTTACLSNRNLPPANFIQWNIFGDNGCATATNYSALLPNTCVQLRDVGAANFQTCSGSSFTQIQAATVADCNANTNTVSLTVDTTKCVDMGDGKTFTQGVCPAGSSPTASAPSTAPTAGSGSPSAAAPTAASTPSASPVRTPVKASSAVTTVVSAVTLGVALVLAL